MIGSFDLKLPNWVQGWTFKELFFVSLISVTLYKEEREGLPSMTEAQMKGFV